MTGTLQERIGRRKIKNNLTINKSQIMGKKETSKKAEAKKEEKVVVEKVKTITRPGGGQTVDNSHLSRRFKK